MFGIGLNMLFLSLVVVLSWYSLTHPNPAEMTGPFLHSSPVPSVTSTSEMAIGSFNTNLSVFSPMIYIVIYLGIGTHAPATVVK